MNEELKKRIEALENWKKSLESSHSIPLSIDQSFRARFIDSLSLSGLATSAKSASSENQSVNEAGAASYSVLKPPDAFDERNDNGTTKYYPYYT